MWSCVKVYLPVAKGNYLPQRHSFIRHLKTQCINLHPRGYARRDVIESSQCGEIRDVDAAGTSKQSPATHRDYRSIDSVDPVVLKYTHMINDLRSKSSRTERVNETYFGSIRFDSENIPHIHGLFDQQYDPEVTPASNNVPEFHLKVYNISGQGGVLEIDEQEQLHHSSYDGNVDLLQRQDLPNGSAEELKDGDGHERNRSADLNRGELENEAIMNDDITLKDNYIDECIFGDSASSTSEKLRPPVGRLQSKTVTGSETDVDLDRDLTYIDEVFFKNSLENLQINRQPAVDYSLIKKDLENAFLSGEKHVTIKGTEENDGGEILDRVTERAVNQKSSEDKDEKKKQLYTTEGSEIPKSAYEYVVRRRREEEKKQYGLTQEPADESNKSYKKILSLVNEKTKAKHTQYEILKSLKSSILYNNHDIVGLHKPYGLAMHGGTGSQHHILSEYLPELANYLQAEALYPVHRLDATTTGVVLLARTPAMADTLKRMFKERQLKKTYWAITKGIPDPMQGIIDIPVAEGLIDGRRRMVLKPDVKGLKSTTSSSKMAVTRFKVISKRDSAALVELCPMTGVKHQLRVHLAFGLNCPVMGDHKYSHLKKMAPQALPGDMLDKLKIKQSKVRSLPLFLHCKSILVPEIVNGRNISLQAKIPAYFNKALSLLKLNRYESQVKVAELMTSLP